MKRPLIIAHRTCPPYAPEDSLEGVRVALEQGSDGVEIDLRCSLDLKPYLMHDNTASRTTGWPLPVEITPSVVIEKLRLRGSSERPPLLPEVLDIMPEDKILAVDVKTPWSIFSLVREVKRRDIARRTLVWCSSAVVAQYARSRLPGAEVAHYKDYEDGPNNLALIASAARMKLGAVSLDWRGISPSVVEAAHLAGLKVYSWHKEYEVTAEKLASGLDGLITDHPAKVRTIVESLGF